MQSPIRRRQQQLQHQKQQQQQHQKQQRHQRQLQSPKAKGGKKLRRGLIILLLVAALVSVSLTIVSVVHTISLSSNENDNYDEGNMIEFGKEDEKDAEEYLQHDTQHNQPTDNTERLEFRMKDTKKTTEKEPVAVSTNASPFLTMYGSHRVEPALENLPKWFTDYFEWHRNETEHANENTKYLILSCTEQCGGFSDRLRAIGVYIFIASRVNRVFCIHWSVPFPLQTFLQPPAGGMDWRCPDSFNSTNPDYQKKLDHYFELHWQRHKKHVQLAIDSIKKKEDRFQTIQGNTKAFNSVNRLNQFVYAYSYKEKMPLLMAWQHMHWMNHLFRVMFEPIDAIARNINATMKELGLVENEYTTVHLRNRYPSPKLSRLLDKKSGKLFDKGRVKVAYNGTYKEYSLELARNALECGQLLASDNTPILFISDEIELVKDLTSETPSFTLANRHNNETNQKIVGIHKSRKRLTHLGSADIKNYQEYFPLFEDLLIMGGGKCVSHGVGSFGAFGAALAGGNKCRNIHRDPRNDHLSLSCPNERTKDIVMNVTDKMLLPGDNITEHDGRLDPAEGKLLGTEAWEIEAYEQLEN
jgi:hypothetical protein